jgi:hypothetical protein
MFIPDPESELFHPGSTVKKIPDPGICTFLTQTIVSKLSEKLYDHPGSGSRFFPHPGSPIQLPKSVRIPDPDPQLPNYLICSFAFMFDKHM